MKWVAGALKIARQHHLYTHNMNFYVYEIFSFSIAIAVIICLIKIKYLSLQYIPFVFFICLGLIGEVVSQVSIELYNQNVTVLNIYGLLEFFIVMWQFKVWKIIMPCFFRKVLIAFGILWIADNLIINNLFRFNSIFLVVNSLVVLYVTIDTINKIIVTDKMSPVKNSKFIICIAFLIFFTYRSTIEVFNIFRLYFSRDFLRSMFHIMVYINLLTNLIYAYASLWIPKKLKYTYQ